MASNYKTKGFSYHIINDADIIRYIEKQPNQSSYVFNLVRQDMNKQDSEIEKLVQKYVKEMIKESNINTGNINSAKATKHDISQLLNIGKA